MKRPKTVDKLVDELGGTSALARLLKVGPSVVSNWRQRGQIPAAWYFALQRFCEPKGIALRNDLFTDPIRKRDR